MKAPGDFPRLLAMFFSSHLMQQREASPHTIASYRDTFRLLVHYAQRELNKPPSELALEDFDSAFIGEFLSHLETERGNSARSRNARLTAIRSFFRQVALHEPQHAALAQRVLAMPSKRYLRSPVAWLDGDEVKALLSAPDPRTRFGRRDRTLLTVAVQTGLRGVGTDRAALPRCAPRRRCPCALSRQGAQGTPHAVAPGRGGDPQGVAEGTRRRTG